MYFLITSKGKSNTKHFLVDHQIVNSIMLFTVQYLEGLVLTCGEENEPILVIFPFSSMHLSFFLIFRRFIYRDSY